MNFSKPDLIFISGTGRSGTHLIGETIASHPEVIGRIETKDTFRLITKIATTQSYEVKWRTRLRKWRLERNYKKIAGQHTNKVVLEKSHPSLWLVHDILQWVPQSRFILVYRSLEATVSSMLQHKGVMRWYDLLPLDKLNPFLGITNNNRMHFKHLTADEMCALRWQSHREQIDAVAENFPKRTLKVDYSKFVQQPDHYLSSIARFAGLSDQFDTTAIDQSSLQKWKQHLTPKQIHRIRAITLQS